MVFKTDCYRKNFRKFWRSKKFYVRNLINYLNKIYLQTSGIDLLKYQQMVISELKKIEKCHRDIESIIITSNNFFKCTNNQLEL
jgi:hypothetical protein